MSKKIPKKPSDNSNSVEKKSVKKILKKIFSVMKDIIIPLFSVIISIIALIVSYRGYYYSRIFEPLVYNYEFDIGQGETVIQNHSFEKLFTSINTESGCIKKVEVIQTDGSVEAIYGYSSKYLKESLLKDISVSFPLEFVQFCSYNECVYQYAFIYLEDTCGEWYLDCVWVKYDENAQIEKIGVWEKQDLLRIDYEKDEVILKMLNDYEELLSRIKEIN